jgi:dephospho-CoA kinase
LSLKQLWGPAADSLLIAGLTGGIASGKSEVTAELKRLGAEVVDADQVARDVVMPGAPAYEKIVESFGKGVLDGSGQIDRAALAREVFCDEQRRQALNGITHPAIFAEIAVRIDSYADGLADDDVPAVVVDAALIVDVGVSGVFDLLLVVTSDERKRMRRLVEFRGMPEAEARERIASQVPEEDRISMADIVIENNGSLEDLKARVAEVWRVISYRARG